MWLLIEEFLIALIVLGFVTQVLFPVFSNRPIFPILRWRKITKLEARMKDEAEQAKWLDSMVESDEGEKKNGYEQSSSDD